MDHSVRILSFTLEGMPFRYPIERIFVSDDGEQNSNANKEGMEPLDRPNDNDSAPNHQVSTSLQHLRPTIANSTVDSTKDITAVEPQDKGHSLGRGKFAEGLISRVDVFAGVIVFSVGILVLVAVVTFYFANGRSWRPRRKNLVSEQCADPEQGPNTTTIMIAGSDACHTDKLKQDNSLHIPSHCEASPSTAKLEDIPMNSVFSLLKGSKPQQNNTSMPALTRTKARSSINLKGKNRLFSSYQPSRSTTCPSTHISYTSSTEISSVQCQAPVEPEPALLIIPTLPVSGFSSLQNSQPVSSLQPQLCDPTPARVLKLKESALALPHLDLQTLANNGPRAHTLPSTTPTMMMTTTETHYSSSIMALYGSPKSSPNGSLADAASIQAMYCPSMKSALSFSTSQPLVDMNGDPGGFVSDSSSGQEQNASEVIVDTAVV